MLFPLLYPDSGRRSGDLSALFKFSQYILSSVFELDEVLIRLHKSRISWLLEIMSTFIEHIAVININVLVVFDPLQFLPILSCLFDDMLIRK